MGELQPDGTKIANPHVPEQVFLKPTDAVATIIPADSSQDFRVDLASIPAGDRLYFRHQGGTKKE